MHARSGSVRARPKHVAIAVPWQTVEVLRWGAVGAMSRLILVGLGGALGAVARYLTTLAASRLLGASFPYGTLFVNLVGCLLIGLAVGWTVDGRTGLGESARLLLVTGLLGGLTTFSSFGLEAVELLRAGRPAAGIGYVLANVLLGLAAALIGLSGAPGR